MRNESWHNERQALNTQAYGTYSVHEWRAYASSTRQDTVVEEIPIAFEYNRISHVVMLATPTDLQDFALGFSISEGIIDRVEELHELQIVLDANGIILRMTVAQRCFKRLQGKQRNLTGRTGCGLCGAQNLEQVAREHAAVNSSAMTSLSMLRKGFEDMQQNQPLMQATGASHAAGWQMADGQVVMVREDVGRHNALDKLIGALLANGMDFSSGSALITSRASYEMVQKSGSVGIGILAAISAPTGLAIRLAESSGLTLVGFVRHKRMVVYTNEQRLHLAPARMCAQ